METQMKTCRVCNETKPLGEFYAHPTNADRHDQQCKECRKVTSRTRHARMQPDPSFRAERARYARTLRLGRYGITEAAYNAMLASQDSKCAICGTTDPGLHRGRGADGQFPIDHDHQTGEVRGLLCHGCNAGLGRFGDDPDRLLAAAMYVLAHRDVLSEVFR